MRSEVSEGEAGGCGSGRGPAPLPGFVESVLETAVGPVPRVSTRWGREERRGRLLCRLSDRFRMRYRVEPGLYAVGRPTQGDPVLVTANYKLSFDALRRELAGVDAWVLVLDTKGINVWCAAGKGTFGTAELIRRLRAVRLGLAAGGGRLILPQLGAPGVRAHEVREATGFAVHYGPVRARDLPEYLRAQGRATAEMRTVRFPLRDRLELIPMELRPALRPLLIFLAAAAAVVGLSPRGLLFRDLLPAGPLLILLALGALAAGAVLVPLLLPVLPFRSFALKGWLSGVLTTALIGFLPPGSRSVLLAGGGPWLAAFSLLFFPAAASFLAVQFTGSTPITHLSGVQRELRIGLPLYLAAAALSAVLVILYKLEQWSVL